MFQEKDLHSGLIGPLAICRPGTLQTHQNRQPGIQEFSLLFHTFDETKSWYLEENLKKYCTPPCQASPDDPLYHIANKFAGGNNQLICSVRLYLAVIHFLMNNTHLFSTAINGYVAETLPGLLVARYELVRWHLLNVGSDGEYHAVHFHGLPFTIHTEQRHRMGVYNLFPGK